MPNKSRQVSWIAKIAEKVPTDVAGSVIVLIVFIWVTPSILDRLHDTTQVYCYIIILGMVVVFCGISMILHAISKYKQRQFLPRMKSVAEEQDIASEIKRQIEKAVSSMEVEENE